MGRHISIQASIKVRMKIFLLILGLGTQEAMGQNSKIGQVSGKSIVNTKAASDFVNCKCQCDSTTWTNGERLIGNCKSRDPKNGALFCYVSGSALCACRDVQCSKSLPTSGGRMQYYSYEACATPARNSYECKNFNPLWEPNYGDGDYKYCSNRNNRRWQRQCPRTSNYRPGSSSSYSPGGSYSSGGSSNIVRPGASYSSGGSSNIGRPCGSSNCRPGGSSNYRPNNSNRPCRGRNFRPGSNQNSGKPSLYVLLGTPRKNTGGISFEA